MKRAKFFCSQCGKNCKKESQYGIDYVFVCSNKHRWTVTIDTDHPETGGRIIGFQCAGARAEDYFTGGQSE